MKIAGKPPVKKRIKSFSTIRSAGVHFSFLAAMIVLTTGCNAGPSIHTAGGPPGCETMSDCPEPGQLCSISGYCFHTATPSMNLAVEIIPSTSSKEGSDYPLVRTDFAPDELTYLADGTVSLTYERPVKVSGEISVVDYPHHGNGFEVFEAQLSVWRASRIPGRPKVLYSTSLSLDMTAGEREGEKSIAFNMNVPADNVYTLRAGPQGYYAHIFPPMVLRDVEINDDFQHTFFFDQEGRYLVASGRIVNPMGKGVSGIQAHMKDEAGIYSSTVSTPTDESGEFTVAVPLGKRDYILELTPVEEPSHRPKIEFLLHDVGEDTPGVYVELADTEGLDFSYPAILAPCEYVLKIVGKSDSGTREPIPGAIVSFSTHVGGGTNNDGRVNLTGTADENGQIKIGLIPGDNQNAREYDVRVASPIDSRFASKLLNTSISRCGGTLADIELSLRTEVTGDVRDSNGDPLQNITIQARPSTSEANRNNPSSLIANLSIRPTETTEASGRFFMRLDPGFYDFEVVPPTSSYLPRRLLPDVEIQHNVSRSINITMPDARLFMGRLVNDEGAPITGFAVRVFMVSDSCLNGDSCETPAFFLGEGETLENGRFEILIPEL